MSHPKTYIRERERGKEKSWGHVTKKLNKMKRINQELLMWPKKPYKLRDFEMVRILEIEFNHFALVNSYELWNSLQKLHD